MHRHQNNGVCRLVVAVHVGHERRFLQKAREGGAFVFFHIFKNARLELLQVLQTLGLLGPCVHPHLPIARKVEHTVKEDVQAHGLGILGKAVDQIGKAFQRCAAAVKRGVARGVLDDRKAAAALLLGDRGDGVQGLCSQLASGLVDDAPEAQIVVAVADDLQIGHRVADLLAVAKARAAQHTIGHGRTGKGLFQAVGLRVRAVKDGKIAVRRFLLRNETADRVHHLARLGVLIVAEQKLQLCALARRRPERLPLSSRIVGDHGVGRVQNALGGAVVLLQLDHLGLGKEAVEGENVLNGRAAEFVNALVVVAHHHQVLVAAREQHGELKLGHVGVLELVHADVAEAALIALADLGVPLEQKHGLHDQIVKIHGVGLAQELLVGLVHARDLLGPKIAACLHRESVGREELVLGAADGVDHALDGEQLFVDVTALHGGKDRLFGIVGIVDGKALAVAHPLAVTAQNAYAERVEGARDDVGGRLGTVGEHLLQSLADLACRLVGKGDGKHAVGLARPFGKGGEPKLLDLLGRQPFGRLQRKERLLGKSRGHAIAEVGVAVANDKGDAANEHGGLSASRARKHEQGVIHGVNGLPLPLVEEGVDLIKQGALCAQISFLQGLHETSFRGKMVEESGEALLGVQPHLLHGKCVLGLRSCRLADDARRNALAHDGLGKGVKGGTKNVVGKGQVLFLACLGVFDLGKMAVQIAGVGVAELLADRLEDAAVIVHVKECAAKLPRVEMAKIHHGCKDGRDAALLDDLVERPQLVDLAHRLNAKTNACVAKGVGHACERILGEGHGLLARDLCRAAAVNDDGVCPEERGRPKGFADIVQASQALFLLDARERDEVGRVQGHANVMLPRLLADGAQSGLACRDAVAGLVFVGVKAVFSQPTGGLDCAFVACGVKGFAVAAGAKEGIAHRMRLPRKRNAPFSVYFGSRTCQKDIQLS